MPVPTVDSIRRWDGERLTARGSMPAANELGERVRQRDRGRTNLAGWNVRYAHDGTEEEEGEKTVHGGVSTVDRCKRMGRVSTKTQRKQRQSKKVLKIIPRGRDHG